MEEKPIILFSQFFYSVSLGYMLNNEDPHRFDLDLLRVLAITGVVTIHCVAPIVTAREVGTAAWHVANLIDASMSWCVPVFVMISGALLINKKAFENEARFFKKRFSRILIPLILWPILYVVFHVFTTHSSPDIARVIKGFLQGQPVYGYQLYFLFLIAGLYLLTPALSAYVSRVTRRSLWIMTIIISFLTIFWTTLGGLAPSLATSHNMFTQGLPYVGYFLLGFLLKDIRLNRRQGIACGVVFAITNITIALFTYLFSSSLGHFNSFFYEFTGLFAFASSVMIFMFGKFCYQTFIVSLQPSAQRSLNVTFAKLSKGSFGVYLLHVMVLEVLVLLLHVDIYSLKGAAILFPATLLLSWLLVTLLQRVPRMKYLFG